MLQVLFHLPFTAGFLPPDGVPVYGFGMMLFLAFVVVTGWGGLRAAKVGLPQAQLQDLAIVLFVAGIAGARLLYMIQFPNQFPDKSVGGLVTAFFRIWDGGIVFYGSVFGGIVGYLIFRRVVLRRLGVNGWRLADAVAPLMAIGMAVGRIGCYLNGCCWGQPVCADIQPVPLGGAFGQFPLLPAHCRPQVCQPPRAIDRLPHIHGLQTAVGFTAFGRGSEPASDPRTVVAAVELGSAAADAGVKSLDRVIAVNGSPNPILYSLDGTTAAVEQAEAKLKEAGGTVESVLDAGDGFRSVVATFTEWEKAKAGRAKLTALVGPGLRVTADDGFGDLVRAWPRGHSQLRLTLARPDVAEPVSVAFTPRTVAFFPTQLYETVSMLLLTLVLLAFQPLRRHDGQVMVVLMLGYAAHRFINEAIRIEPTYAMGLTLSQWISVGIFAAGLLLELYLRRTQPKLPTGPLPLGEPKP